MLEEWGNVLKTVRKEELVSDLLYKLWLKRLKPARLDADKQILEVRFSGDPDVISVISKKYASALENAIHRQLGVQYKIDIIPDEKNYMESVAEEASTVNTFEYFVTDANNQEAFDVARTIACSSFSYMKQRNPFLFYGEKGTGKTRLLNAILAYAKEENPDYNTVYILSELYVQYFIEAYIQQKADGNADHLEKVRNRFRNADLLVFDGLDYLQDKTITLREFQILTKELLGKGKMVIFTSQKNPQDLRTLFPELSDLIRDEAAVKIGLPDYEARLTILKQLNKENRDCVPEEQLETLAKTEEDLNDMVRKYQMILWSLEED